MTEKASIICMQGSSCWGCYQSLLNAHTGLIPVLPALDFKYWQAVVDFKHDSLENQPDNSVDVGFYEGMIRTQEDLDNLNLVRRKCKTLVAMGTCACFGGIPGLGNLYPLADLESRKFKDAELVSNPSETPTDHMPELLKVVYPIKHYVNVDVSLTGCPPTTESIVNAILYLLGMNPDYKIPDKSVCDECPRQKKEKVLSQIKREFEGMPNQEDCFINQGYLCFGMATRSGCKAVCPNANAPCMGCYGPPPNVEDQGAKIMTAVSSICTLDPSEMASKIKDPVGTFYRFSLANSILNRKIVESKKIRKEE